jgi:dienelactone hydrolase
VISTRTVAYDADGLTMVGHLALPDGTGRRPAVLIGHEGAGLDDVQRRRADALAQEGYVALAMDYHGGRWFDDGDEMRARVRPLLASPDRMREIGTAALAALLAEPRADPDAVAAIGYCAGGSLVLELARSGADLKAVVAFHPSLQAGRHEDTARIRGSVLVSVGSEDPLVPAADREAFGQQLQAAGVDWQLLVHGGAEHSFTYPHEHPSPGVSASPRHAARAWAAMLALLRETVGGPVP